MVQPSLPKPHNMFNVLLNWKILVNIFLAACVLFILASRQESDTLYLLDSEQLAKSSASASAAGAPMISIDAPSVANGHLDMNEWRGSFEDRCESILSQTMKETNYTSRGRKRILETHAIQELKIPDMKGLRKPHSRPHYRHCKNTFIDLGSNIGDSVAYFVDNALDVCTSLWMKKFPKTRLNKQFPRIHLNMTSFEFITRGKGANPFAGLLQRYMPRDAGIMPEDTCVYGMEGNPAFTKRLKKLEDMVMGMTPRPVKHLHIHTETVIAQKDGDSVLYLDQVNDDKNFWGSSILSSQQDAKKTAELNGGQLVSTPVRAISLTTLVKSTMVPFKADAAENEKSGGTLIVKMDVEGAEYQVLKEVADSGILCQYIALGNKVVLIVEFHNMSITDPVERRAQKVGVEQAKDKLTTCGVEFTRLQAMWA